LILHATTLNGGLEQLLVAWKTLTYSPHTLTGVAWPWGLLYVVDRWFPWIFCLVGLWGYWRTDHLRSSTTRIPPAVALGCWLAAVVLAAWVRLPDIIAHEQFEFALRLRTIAPLFFLPGVVYALTSVWGRLRSVLSYVLASVVIAMSVTAIWYLNYPQQNPVVHVYAAGVGATDFQTVRWIETQAQGRSYLVLSPQLTSAAALQEFGFERRLNTCFGDAYFYAIPTGGQLYQRYSSLFQAPQPLEQLQDLKTCARVEEIFVVVFRDWDPQGIIDKRLTSSAAETKTIGDRLIIYEFR